MAEFLTIARLQKTQGRRGEIAADILTGFPERFAERRNVFLLAPSGQRTAATIEEHWFHKGRVVLKFAGTESISDAETLLGQEVQIPVSEAAPLEKGAFFVHDLAGCSLFDVRSGRTIGTVEEVTPGENIALVVKASAAPKQAAPKQEEIMIPFASEYIEQVDLANKIIRMKLPAGLLEVNRPDYDDGLMVESPDSEPKPADAKTVPNPKAKHKRKLRP